jgi:hypothetical protein
MIEALAIIGGGGSLLFGISFVVQHFLGRKDARDMHTLRDRLEKLDDEHEEMRRDRDGLVVELAASREETKRERDLKAVAESQRNQAFAEARTNLVERIKRTNVADAQLIIRDLLAAPLLGDSDGVPHVVPAAGEAATDGLIDPFADVQPADAADTRRLGRRP